MYQYSNNNDLLVFIRTMKTLPIRRGFQTLTEVIHNSDILDRMRLTAARIIHSTRDLSIGRHGHVFIRISEDKLSDQIMIVTGQ